MLLLSHPFSCYIYCMLSQVLSWEFWYEQRTSRRRNSSRKWRLSPLEPPCSAPKPLSVCCSKVVDEETDRPLETGKIWGQDRGIEHVPNHQQVTILLERPNEYVRICQRNSQYTDHTDRSTHGCIYSKRPAGSIKQVFRGWLREIHFAVNYAVIPIQWLLVFLQ